MESFVNKRSLSVLLLAGLVTGCGGTNDQVVGGTGTTTIVQNQNPATPTALQVAKLQNPGTTLRIAPRDHLDGGRTHGLSFKESASAAANASINVTVAQLELSYDTVFGGLSQSLGVTNATSEVQQDINYIANQTATGNWNLNKSPIANNTVGVAGVNIQPVTYNTTVTLPSGTNQTFTVSGGLAMPYGTNLTQPKGVVVFFHGTTTSNAEVPSQYTNCSEFQLVTEVFASQGYVVVAPDYIGQGIDYADVHPYVVYPKLSAQTATDMLNAVQPLIAAQYPGAGQLKLFSTGYSEGGAYSVWFNSFVNAGSNLNTAAYKFTHAVGMEGAYSTSNVTYGFLFDNVDSSAPNTYNIQSDLVTDVAKAVLAADALWSYAAYTTGFNTEVVFYNPFFQMQASSGISQSDCNVNNVNLPISGAFSTPNTDIAKPLLYSALDKTNNGASYPGEVGIFFGSSKNSINPLVSSTLIGSGLSQLKSTLAAADVNLSGVPNATVSVISLDQDSIVTPNNFAWLTTNFPTKIKNAITIPHSALQAVSPLSSGSATWEPIDHTSAMVFELLYTLTIFNSL